jgi:hypothetical protein
MPWVGTRLMARWAQTLSAVCGAAGKALHLDPSPGSDGADGADGLLWNPIYVEIQY